MFENTVENKNDNEPTRQPKSVYKRDKLRDRHNTKRELNRIRGIKDAEDFEDEFDEDVVSDRLSDERKE